MKLGFSLRSRLGREGLILMPVSKVLILELLRKVGFNGE